MSWTEPLKAALRSLWADGLSASQIAGELGHNITRNAVIGQVHRMGLSGRKRSPSECASKGAAERHTPGRIKRRAADIARTAVQPTPAAKVGGDHGGSLQQKIAARVAHADEEMEVGAAVDLPPDESPFAVTFQAMRPDQHCRWPLGDPSNFATFRFCGAKPLASCPYCSRHQTVAGAGFGRPVAPSRRGQPTAPFAANPIDPFN